MNFKDYSYVRPNFNLIKEELSKLSNEFVSASLARQIEIVYAYEKIMASVSSMETLASIRNSINTVDSFYEEEQAFFDNESPALKEYLNNFHKALVDSSYRSDLEKEFGTLIFEMIELDIKTFKPEIIPDMQEENKLVTEYGKLSASAKIPFDNKINNLSQMRPYLTSVDRMVRKNAEDAVSHFFEENEDKYDDIYDKLVKCRSLMAKKLGFNNYVELAYARLGRVDYDYKMVNGYRKQIYENVVPIVEEIVKENAKRIGVTDPKSYDLLLEFLDGNPTPKGDCLYKINEALAMYKDMSKETGEFFQFMVDHNLLDLEAKPNKQGGGYTTYIEDYKSPFIFSNFNGTSGDVDVLTHEAGHAFQVFESQNVKLSEYLWPTLEACEIHSMSMEFFAYPYMENFFKGDTKKYLHSHLAGTILFLPYGVSVDEFQYEVFMNPKMSKEERKACWRRIEKKYLPYKVYENNFLDKGTYWYRQSHIFQTPFYYIDYTLAQVCAQQFWERDQKNHQEAWESYLALCKEGGSKSFLELLKVAKLKNPFIDGTVKETMEPLKKWLKEHTM